jgi:hypothetical protein
VSGHAQTWVTLLLAIGPAGCFVHTDLTRNAPGNVVLDAPPVDPTSKVPEDPIDPGERGILVGGSIMPLAGGYTKLDGEGQGFFDFGVEASFLPFTRTVSHRGSVAPDALRNSFRLNAGWMFARVASSDESKARVGPSYLELQYTTLEQDNFWGASIALGAAWEWKKPFMAGPQATGCVGAPLLFDLCARGTHVFREGSELQFMLVYHGFADWVWSR